MKKISVVILALVFVFGVTACGYREGVKTSDSRAYLYFTGYTQQVEVLVDDAPFALGEHVTADDHYQIQPGQHLVEVKGNSQTLVRRQIYVTEGAAKEIQIPDP